MKLGFIIGAHAHPELLARLVRSLEGRPCAVHVDAKSSIEPRSLPELTGPNVHLLRRREITWGTFSIVRIGLYGLRWARKAGWDYAVLLSGQCYPLRRMEEIEAELARLHPRSIIEFSPFPLARWHQGGWNRINRFRILPGGQRRVRGPRLRPPPLHPHGGSAFWCLSRPAIEYVLDFVDGNPEFVRYFKPTHLPDEMFFQTILANSRLHDELTNDGIHYMEWQPAASHPEVLTSGTNALASGKWFARKFNDPAVVDELDRIRLAKPADSAPAN